MRDGEKEGRLTDHEGENSYSRLSRRLSLRRLEVEGEVVGTEEENEHDEEGGEDGSDLRSVLEESEGKGSGGSSEFPFVKDEDDDENGEGDEETNDLS